MSPHTQQVVARLVRSMVFGARSLRKDADDEEVAGVDPEVASALAGLLEELTVSLGVQIDRVARDEKTPRLERVALLGDLEQLGLACVCLVATAHLVDGLYECTNCARIAVASSMGHIVRGDPTPATA